MDLYENVDWTGLDQKVAVILTMRSFNEVVIWQGFTSTVFLFIISANSHKAVGTQACAQHASSTHATRYF